MTHTTLSGILRAMTADIKALADRNLTAAAARLRLADPRPAFRERLRFLKDERPDAFATALRHYEEKVLPELASEGDAIAAWVRYGEAIAAFTAAGRLITVDAQGRAMKFATPVPEAALILHVPDDTAAPVLVAASPSEPSAAQQATLDLLVNRKLGIQ